MKCRNCGCSLTSEEAFPLNYGEHLCERCDEEYQRYLDEMADGIRFQEEYERFKEER